MHTSNNSKSNAPTQPPDDQPSETPSPSIGSTQRDLALAVVALVGIIAISAVLTPSGMVVFEKLLPMLMFVLGYFFQER